MSFEIGFTDYDRHGFDGQLWLSVLIPILFTSINLWLTYRLNQKAKRFDTQLERHSFVYKTQFPQLHLHRSKVILRCHGYIIRLREMVSRFEISPAIQEERDAFEHLVSKYLKYLELNSVYFSRETGRNLVHLGMLLRRSGITNTFITQSEMEGNQQRASVYQERAGQLNLDLQRAQDVIIDEFQTLLGVDNLSPKQHLWNALNHYSAMFFALRNSSDVLSKTDCKVSIKQEALRLENTLRSDGEVFEPKLKRQVRDVITEGEDILQYMRNLPADITEFPLALTSFEAIGTLIEKIGKITAQLEQP